MKATVTDKSIRGILIGSVESLETLLSKLTEGQILPLNTFHSPWGLRIDVSYEMPAHGKPVIFHYCYGVDTAKFRTWLQEHAFLCDSGPLVFSSKGIQVTVPDAKEWAFAMFSIDNESGKPIPLPLMEIETTFTIHRDLFNQKEWEIYIEVPDVAAQDRK
jgi:hypothetical protein